MRSWHSKGGTIVKKLDEVRDLMFDQAHFGETEWQALARELDPIIRAAEKLPEMTAAERRRAEKEFQRGARRR